MLTAKVTYDKQYEIDITSIHLI